MGGRSVAMVSGTLAATGSRGLLHGADAYVVATACLRRPRLRLASECG